MIILTIVYVFTDLTENQNDKLELHDLEYILEEIETDWYKFGIQLKIKHHVLNRIDEDHSATGTSRKFSKMLQHWLRNESEPSWNKVCVALNRIGDYKNIERHIATTYNISL